MENIRTTPNNSNETEISLKSDNEINDKTKCIDPNIENIIICDSSDSTCESKPIILESNFVTRKTFRYLGDFKSSDLKSPKICREALSLATITLRKKQKLIKKLHQENRRLKRKVGALESILIKIQEEVLLSNSSSKISHVDIANSVDAMISQSSDESDCDSDVILPD